MGGKLKEIEQRVDFFSLPVGARGPGKDQWTGKRTEDGHSIYRTPMGSEYFVKDKPRQRTLKEVFQGIDWHVPSFKEIGSFAKAAAEDTWDIIQTPGEVLKGEKTPTYGDAFGVAGVAATGGFTFKVPDGSLRIFGGRRAERIPKRVVEAIDFENIGMSKEDIYRRTGVEFDSDGDFVYTISPKKMRVKTINPSSLTSGAKLKDVVDFKELFESYPSFENIRVIYRPEIEYLGTIDVENGILSIGPGALTSKESLRETLLHEIQHAVQYQEMKDFGFDPGWLILDTTGGKKLAYESPEPRVQEFLDKYNTFVDKEIEKSRSLGIDTVYIPYEADQNLWKAEVEAYKHYLMNKGEIEARAAAMLDSLTAGEISETLPSELRKQAEGIVPKDYKGWTFERLVGE